MKSLYRGLAMVALWGTANALSASETREAKPVHLAFAYPREPQGYLETDFKAKHQNWEAATTLEDFRRVAPPDGTWNTAMETWITGEAGRLQGSGPAREAAIRKVTAEFQAAFDAGYRDPWFQAMYGRLLSEGGHKSKAFDMLSAAVQALPESAYSHTLRARMWESYYVAARNKRNKQAMEKAIPPLRDSLLRASADWMYRDGCQAYYIGLFDRMYDLNDHQPFKPLDVKTSPHGLMLEKLDGVEAADPWILGYLRGLMHEKIAWNYRGQEYAHAVTEAGWKGFREHLAAARGYWLDAYPFQPQFPHIAKEMVGLSKNTEDDTEAWLGRAVAAQFDCIQAYSETFWALRPRWGGSHAAMLKLGRKCLATGRFDTKVPLLFLEVFSDVAEEMDNPATLFRQQSFWPDFDACYTGYVSQVTYKPFLDDLNQRYAAMAWSMGRPEKAAEHYRLGGRHLADWQAKEVGIPWAELTAYLDGLTGDMAPPVRAFLEGYCREPGNITAADILAVLPDITIPSLAVSFENRLLAYPDSAPWDLTRAKVGLLADAGRYEAVFLLWNELASGGYAEAPEELKEIFRPHFTEYTLKTAGMMPDPLGTDEGVFKELAEKVKAQFPEPVEGEDPLLATERNLALVRTRLYKRYNLPSKQRNDKSFAWARDQVNPPMRETPLQLRALDCLMEHMARGKIPRLLSWNYLYIHVWGGPRDQMKKTSVDIAGISEILAATTNGVALVASCDAANNRSARLPLLLRSQKLLEEHGERGAANKYAKTLYRWVSMMRSDAQYIPDIMQFYNLAPGYERALIEASASAEPEARHEASHWCLIADAHLRLGQKEDALKALEAAADLKDSRGAVVSLDRSFKNAQAHMAWMKTKLGDIPVPGP